MKSHDTFRTELQEITLSGSSQKLFDYISENIVCFFSTPFISDYYQIIKDADVSTSKKTLPMLIKAWLAFLCGDNSGLAPVIRTIEQRELADPYESSFYYALKALMGLSPDQQERLKYSRLSIDVLPGNDHSIFMANAKLTHAQVLSGMERNREAVGLFEDSYRMFYDMDNHFPAVVALVNKLLNKYWLGEFHAVLDECGSTLVMSSSFGAEVQDYWNVVHLPLGMCYFELNKPSLAIQHLEQAKSCIDRMGLYHMHGLVELYVFKCYYVLKDKSGMEGITALATADFEHMHYTMTDLLLCMFRIMSREQDCSRNLQPDIERFELEYIRSRVESPQILIETLAYLKIKGLSDTLTIEDMLECLGRLRYTGRIPYLQLFLIYLAEMNYIEDRPTASEELLREAASMYREYGISAAFHMIPLKCSPLLQRIDQRLYNEITKKSNVDKAQDHDPVLSAREREIMQLIVRGKCNEEISKSLFISIGTIKWHINHIFSKLEVSNRVQAVEKAKSLGEIF